MDGGRGGRGGRDDVHSKSTLEIRAQPDFTHSITTRYHLSHF